MYRTKCSASDGWADPAPTVTVTSNHWPRLTESGASILGVCFSSYERRSSRYSGVNCSAWPCAPTRAAPGARIRTAAATMADGVPYLIDRLLSLSHPRASARVAPSVVGEELVDQRHQIARAVRLGQIGRRARVHRAPVVAAQRERGHDHERDLGGAGIGAQLARGVEPGQLGQLDVHEDEVGQLALRHRDSLLAIGGLQQLDRRPAQQLPHDFPIVLVVLDVEHGPVPHESSPSVCRGTVKKNVDPLPSSLSTPMRPPCISTSRFVMLSPRPVPPYSRVIVVST